MRSRRHSSASICKRRTISACARIRTNQKLETNQYYTNEFNNNFPIYIYCGHFFLEGGVTVRGREWIKNHEERKKDRSISFRHLFEMRLP